MPLPRRILILLITSAALITAGCGDSVEQARTKLGQMNIDYTPQGLTQAVANNDRTVVELFVEAGFDLGGAAGADAVEIAASSGNEELLELLLDNGARATMETVFMAVSAGCENIVKLLLAAVVAPAENVLKQTEEIFDQMVAVPGGTFDMGDLSGDGYDFEKPVHNATAPAFRMGKHKVTLAQWDACVADGGCNDYSPDDEGWGRGNRPVINVSWDDIQGFIQWLNVRTGENYRLPSEAEWEYAARGGTTTEYSWGSDIGSNRANCDDCGDSYEYTAPAGSFPANAWGLHDVHGNVSEWVQDCRNDSYAGAPSDGSAWTQGDCSRRVVRGGSWLSLARHLRSAYRSGAPARTVSTVSASVWLRTSKPKAGYRIQAPAGRGPVRPRAGAELIGVAA